MNGKGALPLDHDLSNNKKKEQAQQQAQPEPQPQPNAPLTLEDVRHFLKQTLAWALNEAQQGRVRAMSLVLVDDSGVPQHAFVVEPNQSVPLLAGSYVALDQIKEGAKSVMGSYVQHRAAQAKHEQERQGNQSPTPAPVVATPASAPAQPVATGRDPSPSFEDEGL